MCTSICIEYEENLDELQTKVQFYANILTLLHIIVDAAIFIDFCTPKINEYSDFDMEHYGIVFKILWIIQLIPITLSLYGAKKKKRNFLLPIMIILILLIVLLSFLFVFLIISSIICATFLVPTISSEVSESSYMTEQIFGLLFLVSIVGSFIILGVDVAFLDMFVETKNLYLLLRKEASMEPARELYDINLEQQNTTDRLTNDNESSTTNNGAQSFEANDAPQYVNLVEPRLSNATLDKDHSKTIQDLTPDYKEIINAERDMISQSPPTYQDAMKID